MPGNHGLVHDRQLQLVVGLWILVLADAIYQGVTLPASPLVAQFPGSPTLALLAFAAFAPPLLVALNHFLPLHRGGIWWDWPKRLVDGRFGPGSADRFWRRLRPLYLMSMAGLALGATGYVASTQAGAQPGAFTISGIFIAFGIGFLFGAMLERLLIRAAVVP